MTNALRNDPKALRRVLTARRADIIALMEKAEEQGNEEHLGDLSAALAEIDAATERLYTMGDIAGPAPVQAGVAMSADLYDDPDAPDDEDEDDEPEEDDEGEAPNPDGVVEDKKPKAGPGIGLGFRQREEEEELDDEEEDNPVKMTNKLRKEMGDSAADFLDDYALAIYEKVDEFFDNLVEKALDLGNEDETDGEASLLEMLRDEVGKRGVKRILPTFEEWRAGLIKQVMKDVNERFQPPEPEPEAMEDEDMEGVLGLDQIPAENAEAMDEALEADDDSEPEDDDEEDEEGSEDAVEASVPRLSDVVRRASGPVSFTVPGKKRKKPVSASTAPQNTVASDFKPSGRSNTRLE